ncbi:MAG: GntR family transcriptional regulator [Sphaerochaetaceae bacterium]
MQKIKPQSLADMVYENLKDQILNEEIKGGEKIAEEQLAEKLGVSRTPIREAIKRLSEYGLITLNPRTNAMVSIITNKEAIDICTVRLTLEELTIRTLCKMANVDFTEIEDHANACLKAIDAGDQSTLFQEDSQFHIAMARATQNNILLSLLLKLDAQILKIRIAQSIKEEALKTYYDQHMQLIELIKEKQPEQACKLMKKHIFHDLPY